MKTKITLLALFLISFVASAQIKVTNKKGEEVKDGYSATYQNTGGYDDTVDWYMKLKVKNTSEDKVYFRVVCDDLINTKGEFFQLCVGMLCRGSVNKGETYPSHDEDAVELAKGDSEEVSMINQEDPSDKVMKWAFRIQLFDGPEYERAKPIGKPIKFTYIYDKNLSVDDQKLEGVSMYPTLVNSTLTLTSKENLELSIFDLAGRKVDSKTINIGKQNVDVSSLSEQAYIVKLENENGKFLVKKIIKE